MALKLRVISDQYKQLGKDSSRLFGVTGGRIGRAMDNDWVLPDPERYVSSHHAKVSFRSGQWILEDISTNGVFVNDSDTALSVTGPRKLKDGDRLRFGDYDILVSIDERNDFPPDASGQMPQPALARGKSKPKPKPTPHHFDEDLGEELDITGLFEARPTEEDIMASIGGDSPVAPPPRRQSQPAKTIDVLEDLLEESAEHEITITGNEVEEAWHMTTRRLPKQEPRSALPLSEAVEPATAARVESAPRRQSEPTGDPQTAFESFCRGAGVELGLLSPDAQTTVLTLAGQMLREVVLDLMDALKGHLEPGSTAASSSATVQNPLKAATSVEDVLRKLLQSRGSRHLGAIDALRDAFGDLRNHRLASDKATEAAVSDLLRRLDPVELQERFDRGLKRAAIPAAAYKSKYWDLYTEFYPLLNQRDARGLPAVFAEEFARKYAETATELAQRKRR